MTKKDLVRGIADQLGLTQVVTKQVVQETLEVITASLAEGRRIELRNFGVFEIREREARMARNPRTGAPVEVAPKRVIRFKPGKEMRQEVGAEEETVKV